MYSCLLQLTCDISIGSALADVLRNELRQAVIAYGRDVIYATTKKMTYKRFDQARFKTEHPALYEQYLKEVTTVAVNIVPPDSPISVSLDNISQLIGESFATDMSSQSGPKQEKETSASPNNTPPSMGDRFELFEEAKNAVKRLYSEKRVRTYIVCKPEGFFLRRR